MSSGANVYLVTSAHGLRTHLITPPEMKALVRSKSLSDVYDTLMKSEYATELGQLPSQDNDAARLENLFLKKLVSRFFSVAGIAQGKMRDLVTSYSARFEVENIKRITRAKHTQEHVSDSQLIPLAREDTLVNFPALLNAKSVDEVIALLRDTPYNLLTERLPAYRQSDSTVILEAGLDSAYLTKVWQRAGRVPQKKGARSLIGQEIDLRNLLIAFALKARNVSPRLIEESMIPLSHALERTTLHSMLQARPEDASGILPAGYSKLASEVADLIKEGSLSLERPFYRQLYHSATTGVSRYALQSGFVIAYLLLCECEARNLVTIVTGKQLALSEEEISRGLYEV